ncbi:MAG: LUD domain-containing protein [Thermoleophilia bacterium]|nr:LUD domain-containing protein [Thermoleophilia bacterium]
MDRDVFIARVAARLGRSAAAGGTVAPPAIELPRARAATARADGSERPTEFERPTEAEIREELLGLFATRLEEAGGLVVRATSREEALAAVARVAREKGVTGFACPPSLRWPATDDLWTEDLRNADFGLSEAEWGIAATGSVVLRHGGERGRSYSLLPPVAGFLLPASRVVRGSGSVLAQLGDGTEPLPACVPFVTGPSHSGDIAGVMCRGVHGPAEVRVWLIGDE